MEKLGLYLLAIIIFTLQYTTIDGATPATTMDFIKTSCKTTLHPALCVKCLSTYAASIQGNDHHLAKAAITVSLNDAKSATVFVQKMARVSGIKPREYQAVKDCISTMTNSVASLSQSVQELEQMARSTGQDFEWHMSNVETWVGSALTNQNICGKGFDDSSMNGHVKDAITRKMVYVSQVTSNALALVNMFAVRHRKGIHKP
ncbi:21 kDa protein-like [Rutidosis leptorrhynchoides]|uniref:21 kDa protein-like n=1 Tax=Rutidosis leptorrhynchoides TaxID=125765 RepID=UPI003A99BEDE